MSGLDGSYWNTIDVDSPRLRRRAFVPTPLASHSLPKHPKRSPLKEITRNKKVKSINIHTPPPSVVKKEEKSVKKEDTRIFNSNVPQAKTPEKIRIKEEAHENQEKEESVIKALSSPKIEDENEEPLFDDFSIMSAIDAASVDADNDNDDNKYFDEFSFDDSNFANEELFNNDSTDNNNNNNNTSSFSSSSLETQNVIIDDTTIPLLDNNSNNVNSSNTNDGDIIEDDDTITNIFDDSTNAINESFVDKSSEISTEPHKSKHKESNYIGLDGSYWNFTDKKRESVKRFSSYDLTLQKESLTKRKKALSSYEYEKERKRRRLAEQERLMKYGPRKPSQRSIEERQRLMQQRLATMELNALEVVGAEVIPRLYVGSKYAARNLEWIKSAGVNYIVNCTPSTVYNIAQGVVYHNVSINDSPSEKDLLKSIIGNEVSYMENVLRNPENKVLVHCNYGKSRSPTLVICYLIMVLHWSLEDAYKRVDECRKGISINIGFLQLIESIAEKVHKKLTLTN